jgi:hypothetical protein
VGKDKSRQPALLQRENQNFVPPLIFITPRNNRRFKNQRNHLVSSVLGGKNYFLIPPRFFIAPRNNDLTKSPP